MTATAVTTSADQLHLSGFETRYGVEVREVYVGGDGDGALVALGHHRLDRVVAAWNALVRESLGYGDLGDWWRGGRVSPLAVYAVVERLWLRRRPWCGACVDPDDCDDCEVHVRRGDVVPWWIGRSSPAVPGAFPAMWFE